MGKTGAIERENAMPAPLNKSGGRNARVLKARIGDDLHDWLTEQAAREGVTPSRLVRRLIEEYRATLIRAAGKGGDDADADE